MRDGLAARRIAVAVVALVDFDGDDIEAAVADAALGDQGIGEAAHRGDRPLEYHTFQAVVVVEMGMQGRHGQVVVAVLEFGQALGEVALVVVIDIRQVGDAVVAGGR